MAKAIETELKLAIPQGGDEALRRSSFWQALEDGGVARLESSYFDTPDRLLLRNGFTLRQRRSGNAVEQTLKWDAEAARGQTRVEWDWPVSGDRLELACLAEAEPLRAIKDFDPAALGPQCQVRYERSKRYWRMNGNVVELALDVGHISGPGLTVPLSELELELKSGATPVLFELARQVNRVLPVHPFTASKGARGLLPEPCEPGGWYKARPIALARKTSLDEALWVVTGGIIDHLVSNLDCARQGRHPEGIHQVRVAIRRMRSLLKTLARLLPDGPGQDLHHRLGELASRLGPIRDLDVFRSQLMPTARPAIADETLWEQLDQMLGTLQAEAQSAARGALTSEIFGALMIDLEEWRGLRRWRHVEVAHDEGPDEDDLAAGRARKLVGRQLDRLHRKIRKQGREFATLDAPSRHKLRIAIKRLRYTMDLFGSLFGSAEVRRYRQRLSTLQDQLGNDNDVVMAAGVADRLLAHHSSPTMLLAAGELLGWLRCEAAARHHDLTSEWQGFAEATPPWR